MKKLAIILLLLLIVPQIALAAWWNPLSWFSWFHKIPSAEAPITNTVIAPISTTTLEKNVEPIVIPPTKPVVGNVVPTTKPVTTDPVSVQNAKDVSDVISVLNQVSFDLVDKLSKIVTVGDSMMTYSRDYDILGGMAKLNALSTDISNYSKKVDGYRTQIITTNHVDHDYWVNTGTPQLVSAEKTFTQDLSDIIDDFKNSKGSSHNSSSINVSQSSTANSQFMTFCSNVDQQVRDEISSGGGAANESQVEALVYQRKQKLGCYNGTIPTAECNDFTPSYSTNWNGTCSDHGGIYIKF